jgi:hypothetical protein
MYFDVSRSSGDGVVELLLHVRSAYTRQFRKSGADFVKIGTLIDQKLGLEPRALDSNQIVFAVLANRDSPLLEVDHGIIDFERPAAADGQSEREGRDVSRGRRDL